MGDCADRGSGAVEMLGEDLRTHNVYIDGGRTKVISDQGGLVHGMLLPGNGHSTDSPGSSPVQSPVHLTTGRCYETCRNRIAAGRAPGKRLA